MKLPISEIRQIVREEILLESALSAGDLIVLGDDKVRGIQWNPGAATHGKVYTLPKYNRQGDEEVSQVLGPTERTEWGIKLPISGYQGFYYVDPGSIRTAPSGSRVVVDLGVNVSWWKHKKEDRLEQIRLRDLGLRRGKGRWGSSRWEIWAAPEGTKTDTEAIDAFRDSRKGWPIWRLHAVHDSVTGTWYVNYEADTSG